MHLATMQKWQPNTAAVKICKIGLYIFYEVFLLAEPARFEWAEPYRCFNASGNEATLMPSLPGLRGPCCVVPSRFV